jgi:Transposase DDE domain group 1
MTVEALAMETTPITPSTQKVRRDAVGGKRGDGDRRMRRIRRADARKITIGRCDPTLTAYAGLAPFGAWMRREGVDADLHRQFFRLKPGRMVIYPMAAQLRLLIDANFAGEDRVFGIEGLAADPLFVHLAGGVVPSLDTVYRDLERFDDSALGSLERLMSREGLRALHGKKLARVHLDVDTTVEPLFGSQEGAQVGPNPKYHARPSYHPVLGRIAETDTIVGALLRPGDTGFGGDETLLVKMWLLRLRAIVGPKPILCARIDAAGDCTALMQGIAADRAYFVIKAKQDQALVDAVALHTKWTTVELDANDKPLTQVAEIRFARDVWREAGLDVRVVAMRTRGDRSGKQTYLWQDLDFTTQIFLTNDRDIDAADLAFEYNARAGIEPLIAELKNAWGIGKVPSQVFNANHAAMLIKLLSHNLMRRYVMATCTPELHRWRAPWLRRALIWTPGRLVRSGRRWSLRLPPRAMLVRMLN